jgi:hypothetical protein
MLARSTDSELDTGPRAREVERLCVVTRMARPVADMIRFVIGPDGAVVPDLKAKLPGRGVWVTATRDVLSDAVKRKVFARGFKRDVRGTADLVSETERLLETAALDALAIAGKAGLVAAGFTRVDTALQRDEVVALLHAAEAAADGVRKLDATAARRHAASLLPALTMLTSAQLDLALARPNVVHAALLAGPASDTVLARLRRLERFLTGDRTMNMASAADGEAAAPAARRMGPSGPARMETDAND